MIQPTIEYDPTDQIRPYYFMIGTSIYRFPTRSQAERRLPQIMASYGQEFKPDRNRSLRPRRGGLEPTEQLE